MTAPLSREGFARLTGVSRETLDRLEAYVALLRSWNRRINLVGRATIGDVWRRHILDSWQLQAQLDPEKRPLVDIGSGAGLPGVVLAILGAPAVHLIEVDLRKAAFLAEALRVTGAAAKLWPKRSDWITPFPAAFITARAVAPLPDLLDLAEPFLNIHSICLFLKGKSVEDELTLAAKAWKMRIARLPSCSDPSGTLLRLESLTREPRAGVC